LCWKKDIKRSTTSFFWIFPQRLTIFLLTLEMTFTCSSITSTLPHAFAKSQKRVSKMFAGSQHGGGWLAANSANGANGAKYAENMQHVEFFFFFLPPACIKVTELELRSHLLSFGFLWYPFMRLRAHYTAFGIFSTLLISNSSVPAHWKSSLGILIHAPFLFLSPPTSFLHQTFIFLFFSLTVRCIFQGVASASEKCNQARGGDET